MHQGGKYNNRGGNSSSKAMSFNTRIPPFTPQQQQQQPQPQHMQQQAQQQQGQQQQQVQQKTQSPCGDSFGLLGLAVEELPRNPTPEQYTKYVMQHGFDINDIGLNLQDNPPLFPIFAAPWYDGCTLIAPDYKIPVCYRVNVQRMTFSSFQRFSDMTCLFVFYSMPGDLLQLAAVQELNNRKYFFHQPTTLWMTKTKDPNHKQYEDKSEEGVWRVFNPQIWKFEEVRMRVRECDMMPEVEVPVPRAQPSISTTTAANNSAHHNSNNNNNNNNNAVPQQQQQPQQQHMQQQPQQGMGQQQ